MFIFDPRPTAEVIPSQWNQKPYRTRQQKHEARATARKVDGTFRSSAPVSLHPMPKDKALLGNRWTWPRKS